MDNVLDDYTVTRCAAEDEIEAMLRADLPVRRFGDLAIARERLAEKNEISVGPAARAKRVAPRDGGSVFERSIERVRHASART